MKEMVSWKLLSNEQIVWQNDLLTSFDNSQIVIDEEPKQIIDRENKIYQRITKEYKMIIDFKKKIGSFIFLNGESCDIDIECEYVDNNKEIKLKYNFDDDIKTLIIQRKDV